MRSQPPSVEIRAARASDHAAVARLFDELQTGDPPPGAGVFEGEMLADTLIATSESGAVVGYAYWQVFGRACYVRHLVSDPLQRRRGIARRLLDRIASEGRERGAASWQLNVKIGNEPALRLYESLGFVRTYETVVLHMPWQVIAGLPAAEAAFEVRAPTAQEHAPIDALFDLAPGLVERCSHSPGKLVRVVVGEARGADSPVLGFTSFDPAFPGAFPFRARSVAAGRALLVDLASERRAIDDPARPWRRECVQLGIEDAPDVARDLIAAGGREQYRIAHLRGPLPPAAP